MLADSGSDVVRQVEIRDWSAPPWTALGPAAGESGRRNPHGVSKHRGQVPQTPSYALNTTQNNLSTSQIALEHPKTPCTPGTGRDSRLVACAVCEPMEADLHFCSQMIPASEFQHRYQSVVDDGYAAQRIHSPW